MKAPNYSRRRRKDLDGQKVLWHDTVVGILAAVRICARQQGYAIGTHGTLARDIDLIAVPWTKDAVDAETLIKRIKQNIGGWANPGDKEQPERKPHGRLAWSIHILGTPAYLDISVMPPTQLKVRR